MKIIAICDSNPFYVSSAYANRIGGLFKAMASQTEEFKIYVLSPLSKDELVDKGVPYKMGNLTVSYLSNKIKAKPSTLRRLKEAVVGKRITKEQRQNIKQVLSEKADVLWLAGGGIIRRAFLKNRKSVQATIMMEFSEYQQLYKDQKIFFIKRINPWLDFKVTCRVLKYIDVLAYMTKPLENYYRSFTAPQTRYIHLPMTVDLSRFENITMSDSQFERPYIAFTGTYTDLKDGVSILIEAFAKIANKYPEYKLFLAGFFNPDMYHQIELINEFGLEDRIKHIGILDKSKIPDFLINASVLVLSRPDSRQAQGGFPTKLGEYLATGNPVCVTKVGEIPDYLEDNVSAFMAEPGDVDSFADAMDRALRDETIAKRVGANGRKVAEVNFDAEMQAKRLSQFLKDNLK